MKANLNKGDIRHYIHAKVDKWTQMMLFACKEACVKMVARAKQTNTGQDQTGALCSSIGYVIYHNGVEVASNFESTGGEKSNEGVQKGLSYARSMAEKHGSNGIIAVVVAGMDYALYMESKGKDVLTGSTRQFADDWKEAWISQRFLTEYEPI
jgi:hypothetical protein